MLYPWYVFLTLGLAMASSFIGMLYIPRGWPRNFSALAAIVVMFASYIVMLKSALRNYPHFQLGYFRIPGVGPEVEFFASGMFSIWLIWAVTVLLLSFARR